MLSIQALTHRYAVSSPPQLTLPSWGIATQHHQLVLGPSGCGKSTLLHIIAGLLLPSAGRVVVNGVEVNALSESQRDQWRAANVGMVLQRPHLIHAISVLQNLLLAQRLAGKATDAAVARQLLDRLGLKALHHQRPHTLSQGQAQRVALARALVNRPKLILADEPTASLDDASADAALTLLRDMADEVGATLIIATHDARAKARFADDARLELKGAA